MNDRAQIPSQLLLTLGALRDKAMAADSLNALAFSIANDAYPLLRFRQALVFAQHAPSQYELLCVSGLAKPQEDSPYLVWLRRTVPWVAGHAREAARYQAVVWCVGVVLLGSALLAMLLHGSALATVGLLAFITLLAAAGVYAFYAVLRATNGDTFRYLDSPRRDHPDM